MDIESEIRAIILSAMTDKRDFDDEEDLIESRALDSMGVVDVEMGLEKRFKIPPIPDSDTKRLSVSLLAEYVRKHLS